MGTEGENRKNDYKRLLTACVMYAAVAWHECTMQRVCKQYMLKG